MKKYHGAYSYLKKSFGLILLFCSILSCGHQIEKSKDTSPNIILVLVDDLGYNDVGFNGCVDIPTPNIDRIAKEGVKFTNGYVTYAVCGPSRAGLITGRYQDRFGFSRNPLFAPKDPNMGLPLGEETLANALKKATYNTVAIGKWHLGAHPTLHPLRRGFDDFFGFLTGGHKYFPEEWTLADETEVTSEYKAYRTKLLRNNTRIEESEYLTDALSREAINYIDKYKDNPFFIYLAYNAPHGPLEATEKYLSRFDNIKEEKRKTYAAMVSAVDDGVGDIMNHLELLGIDENTMIIFLSDNGGPEERNASDNGVLREGKGSLFEGGIRVPFAIRWPRGIPKETVCDEPVISLDIFATAIAQSHKEISTKNELDGENLIPIITGIKKPQRNFYWRKYDRKEFGIRSGNSKRLVFEQNKESYLFDIATDISEENNVQNQEAEKAKQLDVTLEKWSNQLMNPIFLGLMQDEKYDSLHPNRWVKK